MKQTYFKDNKQIAGELIDIDLRVSQNAKLANQKVATLKLSYIHEAYKASRGELRALVKRTLLNYVTTDFVLQTEQFYDLYNES